MMKPIKYISMLALYGLLMRPVFSGTKENVESVVQELKNNGNIEIFNLCGESETSYVSDTKMVIKYDGVKMDFQMLYSEAQSSKSLTVLMTETVEESAAILAVSDTTTLDGVLDGIPDVSYMLTMNGKEEARIYLALIEKDPCALNKLIEDLKGAPSQKEMELFDEVLNFYLK